MRYASNEAQDAFCWASENYGKPLELLESCFKKAELDIEFVCGLAANLSKFVAIYKGGFLQRQQSIEGDSPAAAVKDVAAAVRI
jgi:hypothetical protein